MRDWLERIALEQVGPRYPWGSLKQVLGTREQGCPLGQYPWLVGTLGLGAMNELPEQAPKPSATVPQTASGVLSASQSIFNGG